jgi:excisionase family DNA binding protein
MRPKASAPAGYLTAFETCERLGISKPTLSRWAKTGRITRHAYRGGVVFSDHEVSSLAKELNYPVPMPVKGAS